MNRREFIGWIGVGGIASSLPIAISACTEQISKTGTSPAPVANSPVVAAPRTDGFELVGSAAELQEKGQLLNEKLKAGKVLVISDPANAGKAIAVNPTCTHAGCTVAWQNDQKAFVCPCHESIFSTDGKVQKGPADEPLPIYTAKIEGDSVLVKAVF